MNDEEEVQVFDGQSIQKLLDRNIESESCGKDHVCKHCSQKGCTTKTFVFTSVPDYLIIAIKRMEVLKIDGQFCFRKIIDSVALARLRQPRPQWIFKLSGTPIREARMYAFP